MAYERTIWKNREVEYPRRYIITDNGDGTVTIEPSPGNIIEEGTPIIAANMNNIEQGIEDAHNAIDEHKADNFHHIPYVIATGTNSYAVNIQGITALTEGMSIKVRFQNANTGACTLNINGLGAKEIRKSNGNSLSAGNIKAGQILHLVYTGSVFQLLGEGGEYGNVTPDDVIKGVTFGTEEGLKTGTLELTGDAAAADVLSGKTFYNTNPKSKLTGSMPNRGAATYTITTQGGSYTIPAGYHNGSGKVTANFANLVAGNIKKGVNVGGVVGTLMPVNFEVIFASGSASRNHDIGEANPYLFPVSGADGFIGVGSGTPRESGNTINFNNLSYLVLFGHANSSDICRMTMKIGSTVVMNNLSWGTSSRAFKLVDVSNITGNHKIIFESSDSGYRIHIILGF